MVFGTVVPLINLSLAAYTAGMSTASTYYAKKGYDETSGSKASSAEIKKMIDDNQKKSDEQFGHISAWMGHPMVVAQPVAQQPIQGQPIPQQPAQPVYQQPVYAQPVQGQPVYQYQAAPQTPYYQAAPMQGQPIPAQFSDAQSLQRR